MKFLESYYEHQSFLTLSGSTLGIDHWSLQMYSTYDAVSYIIIDNISSIADCIFALCWWPVGSIIIRDGKVLLSEGEAASVFCLW